ncbi:kelch repeat-containing protein [Streptantibioticus ferralitis]|uniref:Kelch repeat-containing protein n=1 Tax=Streptantibioticus ferralitis TaxID=236510 RepID=A0ABT5Z5E2_9ACTN|nr:kelch repeat-containing protein [Streptantibioticus ferralitis]MDF2259043.1 kelch repeat-containing protein [Streptantibioticus ferralitis]
MPTGRSGLAAATAPCPENVNGLSGTCVYAIGGFKGSTLNTVEAYSPATNTWATLPSMPTARANLAAAAATCPKAIERRKATCVYALGGTNGSDLNTVEAYNPAANVWATLPSMPTARQGLAGAAAPCPAAFTRDMRAPSGRAMEERDSRQSLGKGKAACVYAVGGLNGSILNTVEAYSHAANVWATLPSMPTARVALAAATAPCPDALRRTCVYAIGSGTTAEAFDIQASTFKPGSTGR